MDDDIKKKTFGTLFGDIRQKATDITSSETKDKKMAEPIVTKKKVKKVVKKIKKDFPQTKMSLQAHALGQSIAHPPKRTPSQEKHHQEIMDYADIAFFGAPVVRGSQAMGFDQEIARQKKSVTDLEPTKKRTAAEWRKFDKKHDADTTKLSRDEFEMLQAGKKKGKGKTPPPQSWELFNTGIEDFY